MRDLELLNTLDADKPKTLPKHKSKPLTEEDERKIEFELSALREFQKRYFKH